MSQINNYLNNIFGRSRRGQYLDHLQKSCKNSKNRNIIALSKKIVICLFIMSIYSQAIMTIKAIRN